MSVDHRRASLSNPFVTGEDRLPTPAAPLSDEGRSLHSDEQSDDRSETLQHSRRSSRYGVGEKEKYSHWSDGSGSLRHAAVTPGPARQRNPFTNYAGGFAPNPSFIRFLRFILYGLSAMSALATAGVAISVVAWYNMHDPSIKPSWGSLIALIVFGIITPGFLFIPFLFTPRMFRYGTVLGIVNQVRIELLNLFALTVIWISGALAMASDLRGFENCIWDGYYHYPKPADFHHVCVLINATVAMGYTTFGLVCLTWFVVTSLAVYILLYLDQEVLSELTNDMGGRAYRARTYARQSMQPPQVAPTNVEGLPGPAAAGVYSPNMHRRASSNASRRSPNFNEYEDEYRPPYSPRNESRAGLGGFDEDHASRRIPNPDAAVPMSEKQALAERYGDRYYGEGERPDSIVEREAGGPMTR